MPLSQTGWTLGSYYSLLCRDWLLLEISFLLVFWMLNVPVPHCLRLVSFMTSFSMSIEKNISSPTSMAWFSVAPVITLRTSSDFVSNIRTWFLSLTTIINLRWAFVFCNLLFVSLWGSVKQRRQHKNISTWRISKEDKKNIRITFARWVNKIPRTERLNLKWKKSRTKKQIYFFND